MLVLSYFRQKLRCFFPIFVVSNCCSTILSHCYNSRTGSGETKAECHASSDTQPNQPYCFLTQRASNPEASHTNVSTPCTWQPWLARQVPGRPQESLVRDETRRSLPTNPSLTMLGRLCGAPWPSRAQPGTTEPGREPRDSDGAVVQCP